MSQPRGYGFNPAQLIRLRKERNMSQRQLAFATGLVRMGIVRYEQGTAEPRMDSVEALARELNVEPKVFFEWGPTTPTTTTVAAPPPPPKVQPQDPMQAFTQNLALLHQLDLRALQAFLEALTHTDNPLEYDQDLYNRDLEEFQQTTPNALKNVRTEFSLSISDLSTQCGLPSERLTEIEEKSGMPVQPSEVMALRKALGVQFEPRAIAIRTSVLSPPKDRRAARAKHHESVKEWKRRCQRTPNKLDTLIRQLEGLKRDMLRLEARIVSLSHPETPPAP